MRVVHVATVPKSFIFLRDQVPFMKARGVELVAVAARGPEMDAFAREHDIETHAIPMSRKIAPAEDLRAVVELAALLRRLNPDIVHAHTPKGGLIGMLGASIARIPRRVYHMRGLLTLTATGARYQLFSWIERLTCALASEVICVSHSLREVAISQRLAPPHKLHVMAGGSGQGVDARTRFDPSGLPEGARERIRARYGIPQDAVVIGFVGRLVGDKGVRELAQAWREVREAHPNTWLLIVGDFEERDALPAHARAALEDDPRVALAGWQPDTASFYAAMDLVTLPTYREGFPNVPLEAAAMELPVIATRVPGCVDAVADGITGALVPARDARALARALTKYVEDPALRARQGVAGRARAIDEFAPERIFGEIHDLYMSLLSEQ